MAGARNPAAPSFAVRTALAAFAIWMVLLFGSAPSAFADTIEVDSSALGTAPNCGIAPDPNCKTIGDGLQVADSADDIVNVAAGTYVEQVDINQPLTLQGAGPGNTIIESPSPGASPPALVNKFTLGPFTDNRPVVYVHPSSGTVDIKDLKVNGDAEGQSTFRFYGIAYINTEGTVSNVSVTHVRNGTMLITDPDTGYGIFNSNGDASVRAFAVENSPDVSDYQKAGIAVSGTNLTATMTGNTIIGSGLQAVPQDGIVIGSGTIGNANSNFVADNRCIAPSGACTSSLLDTTGLTQSAGIRLTSSASGSTIDDNTLIAGNDVGIHSSAGSGLTADGNVIAANRYAQVYVNNGTFTASANRVSGDLGGGNHAIGFEIASIVTSPPPVNLSPNATLIGNTITGASPGINVVTTGTPPNPPAPSLVANFNRIVFNPGSQVGGAGLTNATDADVDAENNWWGCNEGPGNSPGCDTASNAGPGSVDFNPWLVLTVDAVPTTLIRGDPSVGKATITGSLLENSDGATPTGNDQFPDGTEITFGTDNGAIQPPPPSETEDGVATAKVRPNSNGVAHANANLDGEVVAAPLIRVLRPGDCTNPRTGTSGDDTLNGTLAGDALRGLAGDDLLRGRRGQDCLYGGMDSDRLEGGAQADELYGQQDGDQLIGGRGNDTFFGGGGDDNINAFDPFNPPSQTEGRNEDIDCGAGFDRVNANFGDNVTPDCEVVNRH